MPAENNTATKKQRRLRRSGRGGQVLIYLGKQLRFFINESDWKVLPMSAVIAALVGMVIRRRFFLSMEGSLMGAFALTCVGIWNGCFNSIQSVCRERPIIKREHRSGLHITAYVTAHMIYQFFLCLMQTALTLYVLSLMKVQFPAEGFMTQWMILDIGISMLLITYAADMMSLFISSIAHTTTGAMTVMPFVLIFQLVFSGGLLPLPSWSQKLSDFTISNYGIKVIAAQSGYNELPMETGWDTVVSMRNNEIGGTVTVGRLLEILDSPVIETRRDMEVLKSLTVGDIADILNGAEDSLHLRDMEIAQPFTLREMIQEILTNDSLQYLRDSLVRTGETGEGITLGALLEAVDSSEDLKDVLDQKVDETITLGDVLDAVHAEELAEAMQDRKVSNPVYLGDIVDFLKNNQALKDRSDQTVTLQISVNELLEIFGEDNVRELVRTKTAEAGMKAEYDRTEKNIVGYWMNLGVFILFFAFLAALSLELIDKDKR